MKHYSVIHILGGGFLGNVLVKGFNSHLETFVTSRDSESLKDAITYGAKAKLSHIRSDYKIAPYACQSSIFVDCTGPATVKSAELFTDSLSDCIETSTRIAEQVIEANGTYVYLSSAAVYGSGIDLSETSAVLPISKYGYYKAKVEERLLNRFSYSGVSRQLKILRLFSIFSPSQKKLLFWDIFTKYRASQNQPHSKITLSGHGSERRDWIFSDDFLAAFRICLSKAFENNQIANIANGSCCRVDSAAKTFLDKLSFIGKIEFDKQLNHSVPESLVADISLLKKFGYASETLFEDGLALCASSWKMNL